MTEPGTPASDDARSTVSITGWLQVALVIGVLLGAVLINRVLLSGGGSSRGVAATAAPAAVAITRPVPTSTTIKVTETGTIRTRANVTIAPQVGGRIIEVAPELAAGGAFSAGQRLFVIDPTDFQLALQQAQADFASAESSLQLEEAEAETARREWRLVNGDEPIPALVAREPQIAQAEATVASARARLADAQTDLARSRYALPFDGRVLQTTIEIGQTVAANQPYGEVYNSSALEAFVSIPEDALDALAPAVGRRALVFGVGQSIGPGRAASVSRIEAELDSQTRLAGLVLTFDTPPPFLPGAFVRVEIDGDRVDNVFQLPADAFAAGGEVWTVDGGVLALRRPDIISRQGEALIVERFDTAEGVVTTLPPGAREGLPVVIVEPGATGSNSLAASE